MDFGIFDHMDYGGAAMPSEFYENRLRLAELYDRLGIRAYHLAEHHATPLGMSPSPNVFPSALAQRTTRLRFGPVVYCLPLYPPVRLLAEICMLDHMSNGRLEIGIGSGISPIELGFYGLSSDEAPALYREAFELIIKGMQADTLTYEGEYFQVTDMPITLGSMQKPHPPLWYGVQNPANIDWPAENGLNVLFNQPCGRAREITDKYREVWAASDNPAADLPRLGMTRYMVIAETDEAAMESARRAYLVWRKSFITLWKRAGRNPIGANYPETFDGIVETGQGIAGSPERVRDELERQYRDSGINYMVCRFAFGDLCLDEMERSVNLFAEHVMTGLESAN